MRYPWQKDEVSGGWRCDMPDNITLAATPRRTVSKAFKTKAARGTDWTASANHWNAETRTISGFGRDAWREPMPDAESAKRLAEQIYEAAR